MLSSLDNDTDLDYALFGLDPPDAYQPDSGHSIAPRAINVARDGPRDAEVVTVTASGGKIKGRLSGTPSYMRLPGKRIFQEVWTARLERSLAPGDCGSWLTDASSGELYGHIVAGSPTEGVAYIIPACQVLDEVLKRTGREIELLRAPSERSDFDEDAWITQTPSVVSQWDSDLVKKLDRLPPPTTTFTNPSAGQSESPHLTSFKNLSKAIPSSKKYSDLDKRDIIFIVDDRDHLSDVWGDMVGLSKSICHRTKPLRIAPEEFLPSPLHRNASDGVETKRKHGDLTEFGPDVKRPSRSEPHNHARRRRRDDTKTLGKQTPCPCAGGTGGSDSGDKVDRMSPSANGCSRHQCSSRTCASGIDVVAAGDPGIVQTSHGHPRVCGSVDAKRIFQSSVDDSQNIICIWGIERLGYSQDFISITGIGGLGCYPGLFKYKSMSVCALCGLSEEQRSGSKDEVPPSDHIDLKYGTSTGSNIATMLGRLRITVPYLVTTYQKLGDDVLRWPPHLHDDCLESRITHQFKCLRRSQLLQLLQPPDIGLVEHDLLHHSQSTPRYANLRLQNSVQQMMKLLDRVLKSSMRESSFISPSSENRECFYRRLNIPVENSPLPTWSWDDSPSLWKVARATSAAPVYFEPVKPGGMSNLKDGFTDDHASPANLFTLSNRHWNFLDGLPNDMPLRRSLDAIVGGSWYARHPAEAKLELLSLVIAIARDKANETSRHLRSEFSFPEIVVLAHRHRLKQALSAQEQSDEKPQRSERSSGFSEVVSIYLMVQKARMHWKALIRDEPATEV